MDQCVARKLVAARWAPQLAAGLVFLRPEIGDDTFNVALDERAVSTLLVLEEARATLAHDVHAPLRQPRARRGQHARVRWHHRAGTAQPQFSTPYCALQRRTALLT